MMFASTLAKVFWAFATGAFLLFVVAISWIALPTANDFRVSGYSYNKAAGTITLTRNVLTSGEVLIRSYVTVTSSSGVECSDRDERPFQPYEWRNNPASGQAVQVTKTKETFPVPPDLKKCLDDAPYTIVATFYGRLFGGMIAKKPTYYFEPARP